MVNFVCIKNELKSAVLSAEIDFSKENGVNFPELQYVNLWNL